MNETNFNPKHLYTLSGIAALLQLAAILATIVVAVAFGSRPTSAAEFFAIQQAIALGLAISAMVVT